MISSEIDTNIPLWLEAGVVQPGEKVVAGQRLNKHVSAAKGMLVAIAELLRAVFSIRSVSSAYSESRSREWIPKRLKPGITMME